MFLDEIFGCMGIFVYFCTRKSKYVVSEHVSLIGFMLVSGTIFV